ncbi:unnamed protein product [Peniophora sp. CBMAI 1063]|nr:unnamed protein product [Peniophora sp. CBMAI 1063]
MASSPVLDEKYAASSPNPSDVEKGSASMSESREQSREEEVDLAYVVEPEAERRLVRRIDARIVPTCMLIYLLCYLDRANIGNAKVLNADTGDDLLQGTHTSAGQYLTALLLFIIAYTIFETPSNYMLKRFRPARWLALLMASWGTLTMCLGASHNFATLAAVRFLLGAFEAGLFPGMVYYLTFWYTPRERAVRAALILACATLAGAFGGAIAYGVGHMNGVAGLEAWRWLFILEGIPSVIYAAVILFILPNYPENETWLTEEERALAIGRLRGERSLGHARLTWADARATLTDWRLYLHYTVYISISVPFASISYFAPSVVAGLGYKGLDAQLWTVPPYAIAFVVTVFVAYLADKYEARSIASAISLVISGVAFIAEGAIEGEAYKARMGLLVIAVSFAFASIPPLLSWLTGNLRTTAAATLAVPLNVSIGQLGQIVGIYIYKSAEAPRYQTGHFTNAGFSIVGAMVVMVLRTIYVRRNKGLKEGERRWRL